MKEKLALLLLALVHFCAAQDLTLPYFNIAEKKKVTVNATCGEDPTRKDVYCKLVGYDSIMTQSANEILDGQVNKFYKISQKVLFDSFSRQINVQNRNNFTTFFKNFLV